jgi:hypothetical protein
MDYRRVVIFGPERLCFIQAHEKRKLARRGFADITVGVASGIHVLKDQATEARDRI